MTAKEQIKKLKFALQGVATYLPPTVSQFLPSHQPQFTGLGVRKNPGPEQVARSCYTSWMRTLVASRELGTSLVDSIGHVGEIGPGDTLGVGFAMILSGVKHYSAFDVVPTVYNFENEAILEEMITTFKNRTPIPGDEEFPKAFPRLSDYAFPDDIFPKEKLDELLSDNRLNKIRATLKSLLAGQHSSNQDDIRIDYYAPWDSASVVKELKNTIDFSVSYAAMEHVDDIRKTYDTLAQIIKKGGYMAHIIDFKSHGTAGVWNGYYAYSDWLWDVVRGRCSYLINREPYSAHVGVIKKFFTIVGEKKMYANNTLLPSDLSMKFAKLTDDDLTTSSVFVLAQKK